ncbi:uncharacterized protein DSM5745_10205 [Aspergillus mulundensis]|uniref:Zn(2)-C6 fungal-type domain-containing protein n=1 Tax=Aspergillus mulundensis TaxID=1810919 RepID=A0A3D8QNQ9_9EURO|nr:hypothetical protein DSM5745_10205 [Aspergillus mulundensis]RDW63094.1 hypothetical protein DSM5745_10205 [Aspergillus mulundensis]
MEAEPEAEPLVPHDDEAPSSPSSPQSSTSTSNRVLLRLYTSHFLSTWNSRMFEFGAVVFLASIFPGTLLYASVYALVRSLFAVLFSSWLGALVDRVDRLSAIRHSIVWQRVPVAVSCVCLGLLLRAPSPPVYVEWMLFVALVLLAGVEKLAATANAVSVERDWAVVISDALLVSRKDLNASMRRIDLFCKLVAPVVVSLMDGLLSTRLAIWGVLGLNVAVVLVEYFAIAQVYHSVPQLDRNTERQATARDDEDVEEGQADERSSSRHTIMQHVRSTIAPWCEYVRQPVFLASFALSLLYLTVLSFGPTMVTFLLYSGFSSLQVSAMRIGAVLAEISGTVVAPFLMDRIGPIRSGLWFLNWQFGTLAAAVAAFAFAGGAPHLVAGCLVVGVALSRLGLWGFDLSVQFLVQESIDSGSRARFSATEMALQSVFEMISFATTIVFADPDQFMHPVYISYGAIAVAATPPRARGPGRSGPRRRTGCLTCRARKVRCDEAKPTCANCTRLRLQCVYRSVIIQGMGIPKTRARPGRARSASGTTTTQELESPASNASTGAVVRPGGLQSIGARQVLSSVSPEEISGAPDSIPFDMLGFIGEITSDFQQKHLDLTNGESIVPSNRPMAIPVPEVDGSFHDARQTPWDPGRVDVNTCNTGIIPDPDSVSPQSTTEESWEDRLLQHFRLSDAPPTIFAPVDLEWRYVRDAILTESSRSAPGCRALLLAVYCYSDTHMAWVEGTQPKLGPSYHAQASSEIQACLLEEDVSESLLKRVFASVLLLMLAELISPETWRPATPYLHTSFLLLQRFHPRLRTWTGIAHLIASWVSLLDIKALIAGRDGDPLADLDVGDLTPTPNFDHIFSSSRPDPNSEDIPFEKHLTSPSYLITHSITSPAYTFFLRTQQLTRRIVVIDLHHRARGTVSDEFEVLQIAHTVSADLEALWNTRPRILDLYDTPSNEPDSLLTVLSPQTAEKIVRTFRAYVANFLAQSIYLHRVAFAIYPRTDKVYAAVEQIIRLAREEGSRSANNSTTPEPSVGSVPISFLWPLFIAALEGSLEQRAWITSEIQRMAAPAPAAASVSGSGCGRHPNAEKALLLLTEMTRRQDTGASRTWADSKCVRRELFVDFFVMI